MSREEAIKICADECLPIAIEMQEMGVEPSNAADSAVNMILDEPYYAGSEIDGDFRNEVQAIVFNELKMI